MPHASRRVGGAIIGAAALVAAPFAAGPAAAETVDIQLIGISDYHGRLELLDDNDTEDDATDDNGGAAILAGALTEYRAANPNTLFVSAGDNVGATPFVSAVADDMPTIDVLNQMGLAVSAVGNHEFDRGYDWLATEHGVDGVDGSTGAATWPTLGANVDGESPEMPSYHVETVGGVRVGFVGVVTEQTASLVSPDGIAGITFTDPVAAANAVAAQLTDGNEGNGEADVLVLLAHEGSSETDCDAIAASTDAFGRLVDDASDEFVAIISGHTHLEYACDIDGRAVSQSGQYGEAFDLVTVTYDTATGTGSATAEVVPNTGFTPDPDIAAIVEAAVAEADVVGQEPIGEITADITRAFTEDGDEDRGSPSPLGNFIADVQLSATAAEERGGAQIAFMNPGGVRADFLYESSEDGEGDGVVTYAEAATVQPFANGVVTMTLTGAQIEQVLLEQWQPAGSSRDFLALGVSEGFEFTYDPYAASDDERITSMTLDGEPIDPAAQYRVTVNSFLAAGGDNFTTLAEGTDRQDNGFNDLNLLVEYFQANSPVSPDPDLRRTAAERPEADPRATDDSCVSVPPAGFTDVPETSPYQDAVECLAYWEITQGTSETTFSPALTVPRDQMAAFIARLVAESGGTLPVGAPDVFTDDESSGFEDEINALAAAGIVNGKSATTFAPTAPVSRSEMTALVVRAYDYRASQTEVGGLPAGRDYFPDDEWSSLEAAVNSAAAAGIAAGYTDGTFRPGAGVRRDHTAVFLTRALDLMVENGLAQAR